jgi:hypothetical protein
MQGGACDCTGKMPSNTDSYGNYICWDEAEVCDFSQCSSDPNSEYYFGCTDSDASNYNANSTIDDGSCIYGPDIISIYDVPQDQGGYVFVNWSANTLDAPDSTGNNCSQYSDINECLINGCLYEPWMGMGEGACIDSDNGMDQIVQYSIWRHIPTNRGWEFLDYVDAYFFEEYAYTAPTIETSMSGDTLLTTYKILAHTENQEIFYASAPDSGYSFDNLSPSVPDSVTAFTGYSNGMTVNLSWAQPIEDDFQYFSVLSDGELISYVTENTFTDAPSSQSSEVIYHITATDIHGNESEPSLSMTVQLSVEMHTGLMHTSSNLKSFYIQPEDASVENKNSLD